MLLIAAAAILGGVVVAAMGRGGEMERAHLDRPASDDFSTWADVADYRPPAALLGYHAAATERALMLIARKMAERDAEIDWLRGRLAEFQPEVYGQRLLADPAQTPEPAAMEQESCPAPACEPGSGHTPAEQSGKTIQAGAAYQPGQRPPGENA
jgi:hypothetical protein